MDGGWGRIEIYTVLALLPTFSTSPVLTFLGRTALFYRVPGDATLTWESQVPGREVMHLV